MRKEKGKRYHLGGGEARSLHRECAVTDAERKKGDKALRTERNFIVRRREGGSSPNDQKPLPSNLTQNPF